MRAMLGATFVFALILLSTTALEAQWAQHVVWESENWTYWEVQDPDQERGVSWILENSRSCSATKVRLTGMSRHKIELFACWQESEDNSIHYFARVQDPLFVRPRVLEEKWSPHWLDQRSREMILRQIGAPLWALRHGTPEEREVWGRISRSLRVILPDPEQ